MTPSRRTTGVIATVATLMLLAGLVWLNYYWRHTLEQADHYLFSFYDTFYPKEAAVVFGPGYPKWKWLLPLREFTGGWDTTTLLLSRLVEVRIGIANTWYLFNAILMLASFLTSWIAFRSRGFSLTFTIAMGFGTQLYHTYAVPGTIGFCLLFVYYEVLLLSAYKVVEGSSHRTAWIMTLAVSLIVSVLAYEGWLDFAVFGWIAGLTCAALFWRTGDRVRLCRMVTLLAILTVVAAAYVVVKTRVGYGQTRGGESDIVFNYAELSPAAEDVASNVLTHFWIVITNYFPPPFVSSTALYHFGPDALVKEQHGYLPTHDYLVSMHYVFFWRYFAGAGFVVFLYTLWRALRRTFALPTFEHGALAVMMLMVLVGGPTHDFIKVRPMSTLPVLAYHAMVANLGGALLLSFLAMRFAARWRTMAAKGVVFCAVWALIFSAALTRPPFLSQSATLVGLGEGVLYPDPWRTLSARWHLGEVAPPIVDEYRLTRTYRPPVAEFGAGLPLLSLSLPPVTAWTAGTRVGINLPHPGVIIRDPAAIFVQGTDDPTAVQLTSPAIITEPERSVLVRVNGVVHQGFVCFGVKDDRDQWLLPPVRPAPEYVVSTGHSTRLMLVVINCRPAGPITVPSQVSIGAVSAAITEPGRLRLADSP